MIIGPLRGLSVRRMFRICDGVELQLSNERANCMSENNDAKHVLLVLISHSDLGGVRPTGFYVMSRTSLAGVQTNGLQLWALHPSLVAYRRRLAVIPVTCARAISA